MQTEHIQIKKNYVKNFIKKEKCFVDGIHKSGDGKKNVRQYLMKAIL